MKKSLPWLLLAAATSLLGVTVVAQTERPSGYHADADQLADQHRDFRRELYTGAIQLVMMSLRPGEEIGAETHRADQCFFVIDGEGNATVGGETWRIDDDHIVCVPAGLSHNLRNTDREDALQLLTVYGRPEVAPGTVHATRSDASRGARGQPG